MKVSPAVSVQDELGTVEMIHHVSEHMEESVEAVYVSTIHKAKGREFDTVFLMIKNIFECDDEERRKLYVALTRAKDALHIHCNTALFDRYPVDGAIRREDPRTHSEPREILLQRTYRDVVLDYFKGRKDIFLKLCSGETLHTVDGYFLAEVGDRTVRVAKLSKAFGEKLETLKIKGYAPIYASVNFIVAWRGEDDEEESAVLLPTLRLKRLQTDKETVTEAD